MSSVMLCVIQVRGELREYVSRIAAEAGLLPAEGESVSLAVKTAAVKRSSERQIEELINKVEDFSVALIAIQDNSKDAEDGLRVDLRGLERRVEECVAIAGNSVSAVQVPPNQHTYFVST